MYFRIKSILAKIMILDSSRKIKFY